MRTSVKLKTGVLSLCVLAVLVGILVGCHDAGDESREAVVAGNSMAPSFWGDHVRAKCDQCRYSFQVAGEQAELPSQVVCPNCGHRSVDSAKAHSQPAQRVRVRPCRVVEGKLEIDRWDVVAVRASDDRPAMIKRVIGLPGESIRFVDGDVFADGKLVQKPRHIAEATRIPVFDSACSSADVLRRFVPRKLQAGKADAGSWSIRDGMWSYSPTSTGETRWLAYEQWRCVSSSLPKDQVVSVEDWYEANVNVNRNLNRVKDIWARIEFRAAEECQVDVAVTVGQKRLVYEIDFGQRRVFFEGRSVSFRGDDSSLVNGARGRTQPFRIDVCTFDRQLTMRINGVGLPAVELPLSDGSAQALPAIEIGGSETPLVMTRFRLWRDIHYFDHGAKNGSDGGTRLVAGPNEYLLVGDNVPVSVDSRHWPVPAVSGNDILGTIDNKK